VIIAPAAVFWLACLGQFIGTLAAVLVIALLWFGVDAASRSAARRREAARPPAPPVLERHPAAGRHHAGRGDPYSLATIPRVGPPPVSGSPPWDATRTRTRPTVTKGDPK
jgi:hypothetical protein